MRMRANKPSSLLSFGYTKYDRLVHAKFTAPIMERSILKFNNFRSVIL